jgi:uncharacterized lipoprotein YddW (UPF0748 family)
MIHKILIFILYFPFLYQICIADNLIINQPVKGLWVVRHSLTSPQKIDSLLKLAERCLITDLFVQIRGRGDAYYNSLYEDKAEEIEPPDFDPLAYLIENVDSKNIRVHAWLNVFYVWSKDTLPGSKNHIVNKSKQWLALPVDQKELTTNYPYSVKAANIEGLYVSPLHKEAQQHFLNIVLDVLNKYKVNGIHLDYIRFPDQRFDFHPNVVQGFRDRYVINPQLFVENPELFAQKFSIAGYEIFYYYWRKYLMNGLSDFVKKIYRTVKGHSTSIILSAAVKADIIEAHWNFYQDWDRWLQEGWLDYAIPMNYTNDSHIFKQRINQYIDKLPLEKIIIGIALYNQSENEALRKIAQIQALKNVGYILFSYSQLESQKKVQNYLRNGWEGIKNKGLNKNSQ